MIIIDQSTKDIICDSCNVADLWNNEATVLQPIINKTLYRYHGGIINGGNNNAPYFTVDFSSPQGVLPSLVTWKAYDFNNNLLETAIDEEIFTPSPVNNNNIAFIIELTIEFNNTKSLKVRTLYRYQMGEITTVLHKLFPHPELNTGEDYKVTSDSLIVPSTGAMHHLNLQSDTSTAIDESKAIASHLTATNGKHKYYVSNDIFSLTEVQEKGIYSEFLIEEI